MFFYMVGVFISTVYHTSVSSDFKMGSSNILITCPPLLLDQPLEKCLFSITILIYTLDSNVVIKC